MAHHALRDRRLADLDPELEGFSVDPRGTPEWVTAGHLPDKIADFVANLPSSRPPPSALLSPVQSETPAVSLNDGVRLDDG